jgi:hypothetical protein
VGTLDRPLSSTDCAKQQAKAGWTELPAPGFDAFFFGMDHRSFRRSGDIAALLEALEHDRRGNRNENHCCNSCEKLTRDTIHYSGRSLSSGTNFRPPVTRRFANFI